jgi:hypothetical protein
MGCTHLLRAELQEQLDAVRDDTVCTSADDSLLQSQQEWRAQQDKLQCLQSALEAALADAEAQRTHAAQLQASAEAQHDAMAARSADRVRRLQEAARDTVRMHMRVFCVFERHMIICLSNTHNTCMSASPWICTVHMYCS